MAESPLVDPTAPSSGNPKSSGVSSIGTVEPDAKHDAERPLKRRHASEDQSRRSQDKYFSETDYDLQMRPIHFSEINYDLQITAIKVRIMDKPYLYFWDEEQKVWKSQKGPYGIKAPFFGNLDFLVYAMVDVGGYPDSLSLFLRKDSSGKARFKGSDHGLVIEVSLGEMRDMLSNPDDGPFTGFVIEDHVL